MARPIEFDRDEVLHNATALFWDKGYSETSMHDLVNATGLQPGSIYAAFGNKRGLFKEALDAYFEEMMQFITTTLHSKKPAMQRIELLFDRLISESTRDSDRKGCLLVNTLLEISVRDKEINTKIKKMFKKVEYAFRNVLEECKASGDLDTSKTPAELASFLVSGIYGLRVYNKTKPNRTAMKSIVNNLLFVLKTKHYKNQEV